MGTAVDEQLSDEIANTVKSQKRRSNAKVEFGRAMGIYL